MNLPTEHEVKESISRLWKFIPIGFGPDFNRVVTRLEHLESEVKRLSRQA